MIEKREIRHFHLFCGLGGGAKGFNAGEARVGNMEAAFRCIGGVDVDAGAARDFEALAGAPCTVLDLFDREQFAAFHGHEPPPGWAEATPLDIQRAAGFERPHIVFLSAPCKGFSGLLPQARSTTPKYQALNKLTLRGIWLMLEAFASDLPEFVIFENVPRIASRGRHLLDQITGLLGRYGYAVAETTHDCGALGGLAQTRKRFLMVARQIEKTPVLLNTPDPRPLRGVGEVLGRLPVPDLNGTGGPMHRLPSLQWQTWVRLALIEAGSDWRSLKKLSVTDGQLADLGIIPEANWQGGVLGVTGWDETSGTVAGRSGPGNGKFSVADPRPPMGQGGYGNYGVLSWVQTSGAVTAGTMPGQGRYAVVDPRMPEGRFNNIYRVVDWRETCPTVTSGGSPTAGGLSVADPRPAGFMAEGKHRKAYDGGGHYGVIQWDEPAGTVAGAARYDNSRASVADPRLPAGVAAPQATIDDQALPEKTDQLVAVIRSLDGTWHRPFTTLELAALQGLVDPEEQLELDGLSDSRWRERIGNAVPPPAAQAIASVMGEVLLRVWTGEGFGLSARPIWVRPIAIAATVNLGGYSG